MSEDEKDVVQDLFGEGVIGSVRRESEAWDKMEPGRPRTTKANAIAGYVTPLCDTVQALETEVEALKVSLRLAATLISREDLDRLLAGVAKMREAHE